MRCFGCAALLIVLASVTARGSIIDDFSVDSSSLYNTVLTYDTGHGPGDYRALDGQFQPTHLSGPQSGEGGTTAWFRNDGTVFRVGDTVAIDVVGLPSQGSCIGLALSQSATSALNYKEFYVNARSGGMYALRDGAHDNTVVDLADPTTFTPVTIALTRTSDTDLSFAYLYTKTSGGQGSVSGAYTGLVAGDYYFGMLTYAPNDITGSASDNLSHSAIVPEPATLVMLGSSLLGLLAYAWVKRR